MSRETARQETLREEAGPANEEENILDRFVRVINKAARTGEAYKRMRENEQAIIYLNDDGTHVIKELPGGKALCRKAEDSSAWKPYHGPLHRSYPDAYVGPVTPKTSIEP